MHERSPIVPDSEELMDGDDCFENKEKVPDHIVNNCSDRVNKEPVIDDGKAIRDSQDQDITKLKGAELRLSFVCCSQHGAPFCVMVGT